MQSHNRLDKVMTDEQFTQIIDAILAGKYSWACVLILRFAGYNPLHYIPYRTYNRLMKENRQMHNKPRYPSTYNSTNFLDRHSDSFLDQKLSTQASTSSIADLDYLESLPEHHTKVKGGEYNQYIPCYLEPLEDVDTEILIS